MRYSYAYKTGHDRTVKMRDSTESVKNVHASHCHNDSGLCTPEPFHSRGAHQGWRHPSSKSRATKPPNAQCVLWDRGRNWWCGARRAKSRALTSVSIPVNREYSGRERENENWSENRCEEDARGFFEECGKGELSCCAAMLKTEDATPAI